MAKTKLQLLTSIWAICIMTGAAIRGYQIGANLQTTGAMHIATHFVVFAVLGYLSMLSFDSQRIRLLAILAGIALGFTTELYEHLAFHNSMEFGDVLIDALGVLAGATTGFLRRPSMS